MTQAYHQLRLSKRSQELTTITTHKGLFKYKRLPFGIASAPAVFQRTMENLLQGLNHVTVYLDDILITGVSIDDHLSNVRKVLSRLDAAGVRLHKDKCTFMSTQVKYLGHIIDAKGLHPTPDRANAIQDAPSPTTVTELKSFLGLLSYYRKFLPNLSNLLTPLHSLTDKHTMVLDYGT